MMQESSLGLLAATAAFLGFFHTLTGPDHTVPFIAMSRVGRWSLAKTLWITSACGLGHVLSSVLLGGIGIALGLGVGKLEWFEGFRGNVAGWLLLGFGLAYSAWGIRRALRHRSHTHWHAHGDGIQHAHEHGHDLSHAHVHQQEAAAGSMTPWILFLIFVFGPCEPLIPILMYPAAKLSVAGIVLVALIFGVATLATMMAVVTAGYYGLQQVRLGSLARYSHALAGLAITVCGLAIQLGL